MEYRCNLCTVGKKCGWNSNRKQVEPDGKTDKVEMKCIQIADHKQLLKEENIWKHNNKLKWDMHGIWINVTHILMLNNPWNLRYQIKT